MVGRGERSSTHTLPPSRHVDPRPPDPYPPTSRSDVTLHHTHLPCARVFLPACLRSLTHSLTRGASSSFKVLKRLACAMIWLVVACFRRAESRRGGEASARLREPRKPSLSRFLAKFAREGSDRAERYRHSYSLARSGRFAEDFPYKPHRTLQNTLFCHEALKQNGHHSPYFNI